MSHGKKLLAFWAPPSAGSKAYNCLDTNISYNKRVNELSRETRIRRIEEDIERTSCWQKDEYYMTRLNVMMRLSDAKECTFTPNVGSKMPKQYKELMQREYGVWANQFLSVTKSSFNEWVNAMGDNFSKRFPTIYKYGKFKRALRYWKEDKFIKAYKEIAEAFNIDSIKRNFDPTYDPHKFKSSMFSKENLKLEDEGYKPQENFNDAPNARFLEDVYILIMVSNFLFLSLQATPSFWKVKKRIWKSRLEKLRVFLNRINRKIEARCSKKSPKLLCALLATTAQRISVLDGPTLTQRPSRSSDPSVNSPITSLNSNSSINLFHNPKVLTILTAKKSKPRRKCSTKPSPNSTRSSKETLKNHPSILVVVSLLDVLVVVKK